MFRRRLVHVHNTKSAQLQLRKRIIDYDQVMQKWGSEPITAPLIERFQRLTGRKASPLLQRNIFYCHRYYY